MSETPPAGHLTILVPTRGRLSQFRRLVNAVQDTKRGYVAILAGVDADDPTDYESAAGGNVYVIRAARQSLSAWTNTLARAPLATDGGYIASLGDDHRPVTPGWDLTLRDAVDAHPGGVGMAYGNDLYQGRRLPTAWVMSRSMVDALGYVMLPACGHLFVDMAIKAVGEAAGCITYRPDVVIEHLHPMAGKTAWDESYRQSNATTQHNRDKAAFDAWFHHGGPDGCESDRARVEAAARAGAKR